jgi:hypothetical protein
VNLLIPRVDVYTPSGVKLLTFLKVDNAWKKLDINVPLEHKLDMKVLKPLEKFLEGFISCMDSFLASRAYSPHLPAAVQGSFCERPIAIVRTKWKLQLQSGYTYTRGAKTRDATGNEWLSFASDSRSESYPFLQIPRVERDVHEVSSSEFKDSGKYPINLVLGKADAEDGVVCYWNEDQDDKLLKPGDIVVQKMKAEVPASHKYHILPKDDPSRALPEAKWLTCIAAIDPFLPVTAYVKSKFSDVLPPYSFKIPSDLVCKMIKTLIPPIPVGPVLVPGQFDPTNHQKTSTIQIERPAEGSWCFQPFAVNGDCYAMAKSVDPDLHLQNDTATIISNGFISEKQQQPRS